MKRTILITFLLNAFFPAVVHADDVIPSVSKEEMSSYKNAFGKAISESRRAESTSGDTSMGAKQRQDNFGSKVSNAAQNLKSEILKDNKNFGAWVSSQRRHGGPNAVGNPGHGDADSAKGSTAGGRPSDKGEGHGHGKGHNKPD